MNLLRLMLTTLVLLAQAWPLHAAVGQPQTGVSCEMGCCAAVADMELCPCGEASQKPAAPAGLPPASGRDLVPQVTWAATGAGDLPAPACAEKAQAAPQSLGFQQPRPQAVRLPVLFCSFLN